MKLFFRILLFVTIFRLNAAGQRSAIDSLKRLLEKSAPDSNRLRLLMETASEYYFTQPDTCLFYSQQARKLAKKLGKTLEEVNAFNYCGEALRFLGDYPAALSMQFEALKLSRHIKDRDLEAGSLGYIGLTYIEFGEFRQALQYLFPSSAINREISNKIKYTFDLTNIGFAYELLKMPDSSLYYQRKAIESYSGLTHGPLKSLVLTRLGNAYAQLGQPDSAMAIYQRALVNSFLMNDRVNPSKLQGEIAGLYFQQEKYDSALAYARQSYTNGNLSVQRLEVMESSQMLSALFRKLKNPDSALFYQDKVIAMKDSLYGPKKYKQLQFLMLDEQQKQQQVVQEQEQYRNKIKYTILFIALGVFLLVSFLLLRNNRQKQKANTKIEAAYTELKETQEQLVQREKMASLGELTAGIAHEIQNPLNFVNNFSEVNRELLAEMQGEIEKAPDLQWENFGEIKAIAQDVKSNEEKINHHGKRASDIVKNMLQHSRSSSGVKEPTYINSLASEYFQLAYHGLRAKDKSFQATMKTDLDETIGTVNIIPQDIGRVILNLITNAFYIVNEKKKQGLEGYEPTVTVKTLKNPLSGGRGSTVEISVNDNGNGIPQKVLDKIFQPFFTTKPTGQGTGLGLSLSYDIVKAHGGEIKVKTVENEGTEFTIILPAQA